MRGQLFYWHFGIWSWPLASWWVWCCWGWICGFWGWVRTSIWWWGSLRRLFFELRMILATICSSTVIILRLLATSLRLDCCVKVLWALDQAWVEVGFSYSNLKKRNEKRLEPLFTVTKNVDSHNLGCFFKIVSKRMKYCECISRNTEFFRSIDVFYHS